MLIDTWTTDWHSCIDRTTDKHWWTLILTLFWLCSYDFFIRVYPCASVVKLRPCLSVVWIRGCITLLHNQHRKDIELTKERWKIDLELRKEDVATAKPRREVSQRWVWCPRNLGIWGSTNGRIQTTWWQSRKMRSAVAHLPDHVSLYPMVDPS